MVPLFVLCTRSRGAQSARRWTSGSCLRHPRDSSGTTFARGGASPTGRFCCSTAGPPIDPLVPRACAAGRHARREDWVLRAPERRGWPGRDLPGHGQRARGAGDCSAMPPMIRAGCWPSARCRSCWWSASECLLPAVRLAGVGHGAGCLAMQEAGQMPQAPRRDPSARSSGCKPLQLLEAAGRTGSAEARIARRRLGVPVQQQLLPGPGRHRRGRLGDARGAASRAVRRHADPGARLAGRHAEPQRRLRLVRRRRHLLLPE
jgi:hypothetical protein